MQRTDRLWRIRNMRDERGTFLTLERWAPL